MALYLWKLDGSPEMTDDVYRWNTARAQVVLNSAKIGTQHYVNLVAGCEADLAACLHDAET